MTATPTSESGAAHVVLEAPACHGRRSWREWSAAVALSLMLFMFSQGPVWHIRLEIASKSGALIDDPWIQAAFVAVSVVVVIVSWPSARLLARDRLVLGSYAALLTTILLSAVWSVGRSRTIEQGLMMTIGTAAALLAGAYVRRLDALVALWASMQLGVVVSVLALIRHWPGATDIGGRLAGIYYNRNLLGPVAVLAAATSGMLAGLLLRSRHLLAALLFLTMVGANVAVWWRTGSLTPALSIVSAAGIGGMFALFLPGAGVALRRRIGVAACAVGVISVTAALASWTWTTATIGRSPTLSGRTPIWHVVIDLFGQRPVHGWGFMAIWTNPVTFEAPRLGGVHFAHAHSGYLEVLVGAGLLGFIALLTTIGATVWRAACACLRCPDLLGLYALTLVAFALVINLGETFLGANQVAWTLLAVIAGQAAALQSTSASTPLPLPLCERTGMNV